MQTRDNLYDLLDVIEPRPGMYLGSATFNALVGYIEGFCSARTVYRVPDNEAPPWDKFSQWLTDRSTASAGAHPGWVSWVKYIREAADGDDSRALVLFFQLLHEYRGDLPDPPALAAARRA